MNRNIDLIRRILLFVEADQTPFRIHDGWSEGLEIDFDDVSPFVMARHIMMLGEAGFIAIGKLANGEIPRVVRLTWQGYDYLDSIRDPQGLRLRALAGGAL